MRALALLVAVAACGDSKPRCDRAIAGLDAYSQRGAILWFGEMHGTQESPRLVVDAVCRASSVTSVQLGLEIPDGEQDRIDTYLRSDGSTTARAALLEGPFWLVRDGRSSEAMLGLVERTRLLRRAGATVDIVAFDHPAMDRDAAMAEAVANARKADAIFVGLSGNVHSRRTKGSSWDPDYVPLVAHLVDRGLPVTTFDVSANGGTFWGCVGRERDEPDCGEHPNQQREPGEPWTLGPARDASHDGIYRVGPTHASPPARPLR